MHENPLTKKKYNHKYYHETPPELVMYRYVKCSAKRQGILFNLELDDIKIPDVCPVLGIPMFKSKVRATNNSPSIDRIIPELGYTKGNVHVISMKANRLKNNATLDELERIVAYVKSSLLLL